MATKNECSDIKVKAKMIAIGTSACLVSLTSKRPATISAKPKPLPNRSLWAVVLELVWHQKSNIPINTHPTPIFFLSAMPKLSASSLLTASGNMAKVKNSGLNQKAIPSKIIIMPLRARANLEFLIT